MTFEEFEDSETKLKQVRIFNDDGSTTIMVKDNWDAFIAQREQSGTL